MTLCWHCNPVSPKVLACSCLTLPPAWRRELGRLTHVISVEVYKSYDVHSRLLAAADETARLGEGD